MDGGGLVGRPCCGVCRGGCLFLDSGSECDAVGLGGVCGGCAAFRCAASDGISALDAVGMAFSALATWKCSLGDQPLQRFLRGFGDGFGGYAFFEFNAMDAGWAGGMLARLECGGFADGGFAFRVQRFHVVAGGNRGGLHAACATDRVLSDFTVCVVAATGELVATHAAVFSAGAFIQ